MKQINAFNWQEFNAQEKAKQPKQPNRADPHKISQTVSKNREKKDSFGTIPWLAKQEHMLKPRQFLIYSKAGTK